ncbi:MAG: hypothetical protein ACPHYG_06520 [Flavobacteriales bacterium]
MLDLTKEYLQQLNERIDAGKDSELRASLQELHATDIAEVIDRLNFDHASYLFRLLDSKPRPMSSSNWMKSSVRICSVR